MLPKPEIMSHFQGDLGARYIESIAKIFIERIRSKILKAFTAILLRIFIRLPDIDMCYMRI